jgi:hypothetical protein
MKWNPPLAHRLLGKSKQHTTMPVTDKVPQLSKTTSFNINEKSQPTTPGHEGVVESDTCSIPAKNTQENIGPDVENEETSEKVDLVQAENELDFLLDDSDTKGTFPHYSQVQGVVNVKSRN